MRNFLVLGAMKGEFLAESGNVYENFQMMGYVESASHIDAVRAFFENPQFPIDWSDVIYLWSESLELHPDNGHFGELEHIYIEELTRLATES